MRPEVILLALGSLLTAFTSCSPSSNDPLPQDFAAALGDRRLLEPRLSGGFAHRPCRPPRNPSAELIVAKDCSLFPPPNSRDHARLLQLVQRSRSTPTTRASEKTLHARGISYLLWPEGEASAARAATDLERAVSRKPGDGGLLNDLAVAYFVRAQQNGRAEDLVRALAAASKASKMPEPLVEAHFNVALFLESLQLRSSAVAAWNAYLEHDSLSPWAHEARQHRQRLLASNPEVQWKKSRDALQSAMAYGNSCDLRQPALLFRQSARQYLEEELLPAWAEAGGGDASKILQTANRLAYELTTAGEDDLPRDEVTVLDRAVRSADPVRLSHLRQGLSAYRKGLLLYRSTQIQPAAKEFRKARDLLAKGGSPTQFWCDLFLAICAYQRQDYQTSLHRLHEIRARTKSLRYSSLKGRVSWITGLCQLSRARPVEALVAYQNALIALSSAGEVENTAAVQSLLADVFLYLGDRQTAWEVRYKALSRLPWVFETRRQLAILSESAQAAMDIQEPEAARYFRSESVEIARRSGNALDLAEVLRGRATTALATNDLQSAVVDLKRAAQLAETIGDDRIQMAVQAEIHEIEGRLWRQRDPQKAKEHFEAATKAFQQTRYLSRLPQIRLQHALAEIEAGNLQQAETNLRAGIEEVESEWQDLLSGRAELPRPDLWLAFSEKADKLFDTMILQMVKQHRAEEALEYLERSRDRDLLDLFNRFQGARFDGVSLASGWSGIPALREQLPDKAVLLSFKVFDDRLVIWVLRKHDPAPLMVVHPVGRATIRSHIESFYRAYRAQGTESELELRASLATLYRCLILPVRVLLPSGSSLVIVPDGMLHSIPFAALIDGELPRRYLIESHPITIAPGAALYAVALARDRKLAARRRNRLAVIGPPAFERSLFPDLPPLAGAESEAARIAARPGSLRLSGAAATRARFLSAFHNYETIHFSGHAIVNTENPLFSVLPLAPSPADDDSGILYAHELLQHRDATARLLILAACSTARGRRFSEKTVAGFVRPFLGAGIPSIIASLWNVEDRATAPLFTAFHRHLLNGSDATTALQEAQVGLLSSPEPRHRQVSTWAAFQLFGGSKPSGEPPR